MKRETTNRGFGIVRFKDEYGEDCSIQESSVGGCIWLGLSKLKINVGYPWVEISEERIKEKFNCTDIVATTRMHINKKQAKKIVAVLQKYLDTGSI